MEDGVPVHQDADVRVDGFQFFRHDEGGAFASGQAMNLVGMPLLHRENGEPPGDLFILRFGEVAGRLVGVAVNRNAVLLLGGARKQGRR